MAKHTLTDCYVALKIINRKKVKDLDLSKRIKREIKLLKLLRHPHIIKLYEVNTTPTDIIMVIEYANRELFDFIANNGKMSEEMARKFFQSIIAAVDYCHEHKIVHRDLKPENLLLDSKDNLKIADFGLSNFMSDGNFLKTSCGSPNYAPPEVIGGKLYAGPEVDIWSCGVILYVMLCGKMPFDDESIPALFQKINEGNFQIPDFVSNGARDLLNSMIVVNPVQRTTIAKIKEHPWFKLNYPSYLKLENKLTFDSEDQQLDLDIVRLISQKLKMKPEEVIFILQSGNEAHQQISVSYQLLKDQKKLKENSDYELDNANNGIPENNTEVKDKEKTVEILSSSLPKDIHILSNDSFFSTKSENKDLGKKNKSRWYFGLRSKNAPMDIMLEIYKSLKKLGMEWIYINHYLVQCRYKFENEILVVFQLQLYSHENGGYLVDFKHLPCQSNSQNENEKKHSDTFAFFIACKKVIVDLTLPQD